MTQYLLTMFCFIGGAVLLITLIVLAVITVYVLPYITWYGWNQGTKGIPRNPPSNKFPAGKKLMHEVKNATKLYRSWIEKKPHNITDW